jgi:hypothetical protein
LTKQQQKLRNKREYWELYFSHQLSPSLYAKYKGVFELDPWNYFYFMKSLMVNKFRDRNEPVDCIYVNDLWALPVGCLLKELLDVPLIYDTHEIGAANFESPVLQVIAQDNENWMYKVCDRFVTVNDSVADHYHNLYPYLEPAVVTNAHKYVWEPPSNIRSIKERLSIPWQTPLAVYVGGLHRLSHMDRFIQALPECQSNLHLVIFGANGDINRFKELASKLDLINKRVFFLGRVNFADIFPAIFGADFGIIPNIRGHLNGTVISSSKMFDYIQAELPFIADHGVEIQKILDQFKIGSAVDFQQEHSAIAKLLDDFYYQVKSGTFSLEERKRAKNSVVWPMNVVDLVYPQKQDASQTIGSQHAKNTVESSLVARTRVH